LHLSALSSSELHCWLAAGLNAHVPNRRDHGTGELLFMHGRSCCFAPGDLGSCTGKEDSVLGTPARSPISDMASPNFRPSFDADPGFKGLPIELQPVLKVTMCYSDLPGLLGNPALRNVLNMKVVASNGDVRYGNTNTTQATARTMYRKLSGPTSRLVRRRSGSNASHLIVTVSSLVRNGRSRGTWSAKRLRTRQFSICWTAPNMV